jgi:hypothetical protein
MGFASPTRRHTARMASRVSGIERPVSLTLISWN